MNLSLNMMEARVLGCLLEKAVTTPDYYPLTLGALTAACNQKSNREPVIQADEETVVRAIDSLRDKQLASSIALAGSRAPKYRHCLPDVLALTPRQQAVICELILRGAQTAGELRSHAARMAAFADTNEVQNVLDELSAWPDGPLVGKLPRQAGQREERYAHRLCGEIPAETAGPHPLPEPARITVLAENERIAALETRLAALSDEVESLRVQFADFIKQFQ